MPEPISVFRSPEGEAQYRAAYDAVLQQWPVPYERLFIPTRFGETHVIASGVHDAAPVILLHPAGCGAVIWSHNVEALSRSYRTYAVDTMGEVNLSRVTRALGKRENFVDWTEDLLDGLQIKSAHIIGNSFGGFVALNAAQALPDRIGKVVLISPAATLDPMWPFYWHFTPAYIFSYMLRSPSLLSAAFEWIWQGYPREDCIGQLRLVTSREGIMRHGPPAVLRDRELRQLPMPILLLIGDHEVIYDPQRVIRRARRLIPNLRAEVIPNANHIAEYTAADTVNTRILDFFGGTGDEP